MNNWYEIKAKGDKSAEINIYGDIGDSWWGESVTASQFVKDLNALDADQITVRINSYGGSVADGLAIYNAIKRHKASTITVVDGVAVSIASLIAMAGDSVEMAENSMLMIHAPWSYAEGNAVDLREAANVLDKYASAMASSYADKSGKTLDAVMSWLTDGVDHWFTAAEALAENLIDKTTQALPVTASFNGLTRYKSLPVSAGIFTKPPVKEQPMVATTTPASAESTETTDAKTKPIAMNEADIKARVLADEQQRRNDIKSRFAPAFMKFTGVPELLDECLHDSTIGVQAAADRLMKKLGEGITPSAGHYAPRVETGETDAEKFARGATQAILARCGKDKADPQNELRGMRLEDMAKASLERSGRKISGMDRLSIARAALAQPRAEGFGQTTSDFPVLLENVMHRMVLTAYQQTPDVWSLFCKTGSVSDFREWQRLRSGAIADIEDVTEAGEYKNRVIPDLAKEGISAKRRGNIIGITPEIIINDDIGYISDLTTMFGRAAKRTIENKVFALLASNPLLKDGQALFHASRGNLAATGSIVSVDSLDAARVAMASHKDISGQEFLDIRPSIWLGSIGQGGNARVVVNSQYDPDTANKLQRPNKVNGLVSNIIDTPRIAGTAWYLFADPSVAPVIEVVFLDGQSEPILAMEENFTTAGINYRVELPFGVGAIGFEGAYKDGGA